jgi:hypothetical protein
LGFQQLAAAASAHLLSYAFAARGRSARHCLAAAESHFFRALSRGRYWWGSWHGCAPRLTLPGAPMTSPAHATHIWRLCCCHGRPCCALPHKQACPSPQPTYRLRTPPSWAALGQPAVYAGFSRGSCCARQHGEGRALACCNPIADSDDTVLAYGRRPTCDLNLPDAARLTLTAILRRYPAVSVAFLQPCSSTQADCTPPSAAHSDSLLTWLVSRGVQPSWDSCGPRAGTAC